MSQLRVIIAGGGTGGHIFPAVAIGHALKRLVPDAAILFVGANGRMEMEKVPQEGFEIIGLDIAGFNRSNLLSNLSLPLKLIRSRIKARRIIRSFTPGVVVGVGGYASFPILSAAGGLGVPSLIQEQNSYAGKSNKILSKKAKAVCVAYDHMDRFFPASKIILTGNPVRKMISESQVTSVSGKAFFGLDNTSPTLLVTGGSLGAKSINEAVDHCLADLVGAGIQVLWQAGKLYYQQANGRAAAFGDRVKVYDFVREMDKAYAAADIVLSRAGALAIAEQCIAAKPVIFVPLPSAAEDHQTSNAMALVNKGAAIMVPNNEIMDQLMATVETLLKDTTKQETMKLNLAKLAIRDADDRIARKIIEIATN